MLIICGLATNNQKEVVQQTQLTERKLFFYGKEIQQNLSTSFLNYPCERVIYKYDSDGRNDLEFSPMRQLMFM